MISPILFNNISNTHYKPMSFKSSVLVKPERRRNFNEFRPTSIPPISPIYTTIEKSRNSYHLFQAKVNSIFFDCTRNEGRNPARAIGVISYNDEKYNDYINLISKVKLKSGVQVKNFVNDNDIISGKIILDNGTKSEGNRVLARLKNAIKERRIEVSEIGLFGVTPNTDYADTNKVNSILEEMNYIGKPCSKITNRKANGYHSIVVKIPLEDGFYGTLEIMGKEVAKLKTVEDVIHSLKKGIPVDKKYDSLKNAYKLLSEEELNSLKKYTKQAYTTARADELFGRTSANFIPISEYNLPAIFDFNNIAKM